MDIVFPASAKPSHLNLFAHSPARISVSAKALRLEKTANVDTLICAAVPAVTTQALYLFVIQKQ